MPGCPLYIAMRGVGDARGARRATPSARARVRSIGPRRSIGSGERAHTD